MQSFKIVALFLLTVSGGYVKLLLKYIIVGNVGRGEVGNIIFYSSNLFLLVTKDHMQIFKIVAVLLLGYIWLNLKFPPKYTIVGGEGGVSEFF